MDTDEHDESVSPAHVEFATMALDRFSNWVRFADAKAGAVMVVLGIALNDLLSRAGPLTNARLGQATWGYVASGAFWAACVMAVLTVSAVVGALFPKVTAKEESLAYFGDVAKHPNAREYRQALLNLPDEKLVDHIFTQAYDLACIARDKFERTRWAFRFVFVFLAAWAVARLALAWSV